MRTYLSNILPNILSYSKKLDDKSLLVNQNWILFNDLDKSKTVFIFRKEKNELIISNDGDVTKGRWEYFGKNTLLIENGNKSTLFRLGFIDDSILALCIDGQSGYVIFLNEPKISQEINEITSLDSFLSRKYLKSTTKSNSAIPIATNKNDLKLPKAVTVRPKPVRSKAEIKYRKEHRLVTIKIYLMIIGIILLISIIWEIFTRIYL